MIAECTICDELDGVGVPLHVELVRGAPADRTLLSDGQFVVVPSIGALTPGHVLIVPRRHELSTLGLPPEELGGCARLIADVGEILRGTYGGEVVIFEHGSCGMDGGHAGSCVDHAHLHMLPAGPEFVEASRARLGGGWHAGSSLEELAPLAAKRPYLLVGSQSMRPQLWVRSAPLGAPSQLFRHVYSALAGRPDEWDWRRYPREVEFQETLAKWPRQLSTVTDSGSEHRDR